MPDASPTKIAREATAAVSAADLSKGPSLALSKLRAVLLQGAHADLSVHAMSRDFGFIVGIVLVISCCFN